MINFLTTFTPILLGVITVTALHTDGGGHNGPGGKFRIIVGLLAIIGLLKMIFNYQGSDSTYIKPFIVYTFTLLACYNHIFKRELLKATCIILAIIFTPFVVLSKNGWIFLDVISCIIIINNCRLLYWCEKIESLHKEVLRIGVSHEIPKSIIHSYYIAKNKVYAYGSHGDSIDNILQEMRDKEEQALKEQEKEWDRLEDLAGEQEAMALEAAMEYDERVRVQQEKLNQDTHI